MSNSSGTLLVQVYSMAVGAFTAGPGFPIYSLRTVGAITVLTTQSKSHFGNKREVLTSQTSCDAL